MTLPLLAVGAVGVVSVASNWAGPLMARLVEAFVRGDIDGARAANRLLFDSYDFESSEDHPNPEPAKAAVRALGLPAGQCRLPNAPATAELDARAGAVVATVTADAGGASVG